MKLTRGISLKLFFELIALFFIALPLILPYFHTGFFPTHDGEWAVVRLAEMVRELKDRQFPPRFSVYLNSQYGYPLFNFAYPFPYFLGASIHLLKIGYVETIKIIFASTVIFSAILMFFLSRKLWQNTTAGLVSAVLYLYYPYRLIDLYVRGSIGESISFALFPLLFWLVLKIKEQSNPWRFMGIAASVYGILITTHNITALEFSFILIIFIMFITFISGKFIKHLMGLGLGLGLAAFFWIPALWEKSFILLSEISIAERNLYFASLSDLLIPRWGYGAPTESNGFGYQIGLPHIAVFFFIISLLFFQIIIKHYKLKSRSYELLAVFFTVLTGFLIMLLFPQSRILWEKTPLFREINYPWTLLAPIGFLISLSAGYLSNFRRIQSVGFIAAIYAIILYIGYAKPQGYVNRGDEFYTTNQATTTSSREYTPIWVKNLPTESPKTRIESSTETKIYNFDHRSNRYSFAVQTTSGSEIKINTIYYPGWEWSIDGKLTAVSYSNPLGVMTLQVPAGRHEIRGRFRETPVRLIADFISIASALIILKLTIGKTKMRL